jgi:hypothetical protein
MDAAIIGQLRGLLAEALAPINQRLDGIDQRLDGIETGQKRLAVFQMNSLKTRSEPLEILPNQMGQLPTTDYPESISHLLVAGNERLPTTGLVNTWNKRKSRALLAFYNASDNYDSETDNEYSDTARSTRLKLCKVLGVTAQQIQQVSLTLLDI